MVQTIRSLVFVLCSLGFAQHLGAQASVSARRDSILHQLRSDAVGSRAAARFLRSTDDEVDRPSRRALVDSLVALHEAADGSTAHGFRVRSEARIALGLAAMSEGPGAPLEEAGEGLYRLARAGSGGAVYLMTQRADRASALRDLRQIALLEETISSAAIRQMATNAGPEGVAVLRGLFESNAVVNRAARRDLEFFARVQGWRRPDPSP